MLVASASIKKEDVVTLRLVSGDEVVGQLVDLSGHGSVTLRYPISAVMQPTRSGEIGLAFGPFIASIEEESEVEFPATAILTRPVKTRDDVAKGYREATKPKSAIIQPPKGLIVPK